MARQGKPNFGKGKRSSFGKIQKADSDFRANKRKRTSDRDDKPSDEGSSFKRRGGPRSTSRPRTGGFKRRDDSYGKPPREGGDNFRERRSSSFNRPRRDDGDERRDSSSRPRRSFGDRDNQNTERRKSYGDRGGDRRRSFGDRDNSGSDRRRRYGDRDNQGSDRRRSYGDRDNQGSDRRRSYGDRDNQGSDRRRSYVDRENKGSDRRRREGASDDRRKSYGDRDQRRERRKSFDDHDGKPERKNDKKTFLEFKVDQQQRRQEKSETQPSAVDTDKDGLIRLNKFISNSGVCSRREADELIKMGLITVNGVTVTEMGHKVKPTDDVRHEGKKLTAERPVYILLNKPKGFITTTDDPQERNTVMDLIAGACKERVYPVGRLDRNTTGLLLLTNDGDLADKLTHPSYNAKKIYKVELDQPINADDFQKIIDGVHLEEGKAMVDDLAVVSDDRKTVGIEIHIGWNHVVRRIFDALGYQVVKLDRVVYAGLDKKDLKRGDWRFLKTDEIIKLKHFGK